MADRNGDCFDLIASAAAGAPDDVAVRHGATVLTYGELLAEAYAVARWLRANGIGRDDVVATVLDRSPRTVVAMLGAWAAGAAYVHVEPAEPDARVSRLLEATGAKAVLVDEAHHRRTTDAGLPQLRLDLPVPAAPDFAAVARSPRDCAYLVCTSGSTGTQKIVAVDHGNVAHYVSGFTDRIAPLAPGSFGTTTTFASDLGNTCVFGALSTGARLDLYDRELVLDPVAFAAELQRHPVDALKYTPSHLAALSRHGALGGLLPRQLLVLGGETLPPRLCAAVLAARADLAVFNHYGPSETTVGVLMHRVDSRDVDRERVPIGTALPGTIAQVCDADARPVADGVVGELHLSGAGVSRGYVGDPASTAARFHDHGGRRCYRSGDLAVVNADGETEFLGRVDRQVKIRGYRVEPAAIESELLTHPGVAQSLVVAEQPAPEESLELVAYVVGSAEPAELLGHLRSRLTAGHLPSAVHLVDRIPVTANGKADLALLRVLAGRPAPGAAPAAAPGRVAPRTEAERIVAGAWCAALKRPTVDLDTKFVDLGGDSFKSLMVFGRLRRHFPHITIAQLFAHPTVAELAAVLSGTGPVGQTPAAPASAVEL